MQELIRFQNCRELTPRPYAVYGLGVFWSGHTLDFPEVGNPLLAEVAGHFCGFGPFLPSEGGEGSAVEVTHRNKIAGCHSSLLCIEGRSPPDLPVVSANQYG